MDDIGKFFEDFGKENKDESGIKEYEFSVGESGQVNDDGEAIYTGSTRIISIPGK